VTGREDVEDLEGPEGVEGLEGGVEDDTIVDG
jgi:hypothetical protein